MGERPAGRTEQDPWQGLALVGLGALLGGGLLVHLTGALAGTLFGGGAPTLPLSDSTQVLFRLPQHLHDPRLAWPADARAVLPGPVGWWTAFALLLTGVGTVLSAGLVGRRTWRRRGRSDALATSRDAEVWGGRQRRRPPAPPVSGVPESKAWATSTDVADLAVSGPVRGRIVLGHAYGRLIATEPEHSLLVVGATRSGKTTGFAIPALRDWDGPAIVLSAKTDLVHATSATRAERGDVLVYDPTGVSGLPSAGWSPLARSTDWRGAVRTANALSRLSGTTAGLGGSNHWERVAAQLLAPLLYAAAQAGLDMGEVVRWVMTKDVADPARVLLELGMPGVVALESLKGYVELEARGRDSAFSTVRTVLDAYEDPDVVTASRHEDITPHRLLDGSAHTLYLVANSGDQARLAPVFLALLDEMLQAAFAAASRRRATGGSPFLRDDGTEAPRLLVLLDEAANIAPLPDLATLASTGGGEGVQLLTIYQDLSQLRHRYGTEWGSIVSNHVCKVVLPGVTDPETLRYFTSTAGQEDVLVEATSTGDGRRSTSSSPQRRDILDDRRLRELQPGEGVVLYGHRRPMRLRLRS